MFWSFVTLLVFGVCKGDMERFPGPDEADYQLRLWHDHLDWLDRQESVSGRQWTDQFNEWRQQTRTIIVGWDLLWRTQFAQSCDDDYFLEQACALRRHIGAAAYEAGWLQKYPSRD
jgi:hypothetical protein